MTKTSLFCSIHQENTCKSCLHSNLIILTDFHSFTVKEDKLQTSQFEDFSSGPGMRIWSKFEKNQNFLILFQSLKKYL